MDEATTRQALADLSARYAAGVDDRDLRAVGELFVEDGRLVLPDPPQRLDPVVEHVGREQVVQALRQLEAVARTFHEVVGAVHELGADGTTARGRVAGVAHHLTPDGEGRFRDLVWYLHYDDTYRVVEGTWRIGTRRLVIDAIATHPVRAVRGVAD